MDRTNKPNKKFDTRVIYYSAMCVTDLPKAIMAFPHCFWGTQLNSTVLFSIFYTKGAKDSLGVTLCSSNIL